MQSGPSSRGSRSSNRTSRAPKRPYRTANGDWIGSLGPTRDAPTTLVSEREVLFAGANRHGQPVLPWRGWAHGVGAVRAGRGVRQGEGNHVFLRRGFLGG